MPENEIKSTHKRYQQLIQENLPSVKFVKPVHANKPEQIVSEATQEVAFEIARNERKSDQLDRLYIYIYIFFFFFFLSIITQMYITKKDKYRTR